MNETTKQKRRPLLGLASLFAVLTLLLAACNGGGDSDVAGGDADTGETTADTGETTGEADGDATDGGEPVTIRFGAVTQAAMFPVFTAIEQGFFEERGIEIDLTPYPGFDALYTAYRSGAVDCGAGGLPSVVDLRGEGVPIKIIYGSNIVTNDVLVPADSDIQSFEDLQGERIGSFGGPQGSSANLFLAVNRAFFGFDPMTDAEVQYAAPPLLASLAQDGELAAFLSIDPIAAQLIAEGGFRSIGDTGEIYREEQGHAAYIGSYDCMEEFAQQNPEAMSSFVEAIQDGVNYLQDNDEAWAQVMAEHYDITDPAVVAEMRERTADRLPLEWDQEVIDEQIAFLEFLQEHGEEGFMDDIDTSVFTFEYMPEEG